MINYSFVIEERGIEYKFSGNTNDESILIHSVPRNYPIEFKSCPDFTWFQQELLEYEHPLVLVDSNVNKIIPNINCPKIILDAVENNKNIDSVLSVCDFLIENAASKTSMLFVVGGGIIQDIGAFSAYMYKRGIPWTFIPTTLLAQADSCVGGKTALNYNGTKNVLALFSAPNKVIIDTKFLTTLSTCDIMSGYGEIFRLLITGGKSTFDSFYFDGFSSIDSLIKLALSVKQKIIENDEFELNIRKVMNYGHSMGHAIESLSGYVIPHGIAVTIGILIENRIAKNRGLLSVEEELCIFDKGKFIIPKQYWGLVKSLDYSNIINCLNKDKKTEGMILRMPILHRLGVIRFIDFPLNNDGKDEIIQAIVEL